MLSITEMTEQKFVRELAELNLGLWFALLSYFREGKKARIVIAYSEQGCKRACEENVLKLHIVSNKR